VNFRNFCNLIICIIFYFQFILAEEYYFYHKQEYGSEALFNPMSVVVNNGFDILQFFDKNRNISQFSYSKSYDNILNTALHPIKAIRGYGIRKFINNEIIPLDLNFSINGEQWYPNYTIHLIGNGMTSRKLSEWYSAHNYHYPIFYGIFTSMTFHLLNEVMENEDYIGYNLDALADLYIFDLAGIILFRSDNVCKFFSDRLNLADWSLQPAIKFNNFEIHNQGQYYSMKLKIPFKNKLYLFSSFGLDGLFGLSYKLNNNNFLSFGYGYIARENTIIEENQNIKGVKLEQSFGLFFDKNNSLLASIRYCDKFYYRWLLNMYPGCLGSTLSKWSYFIGLRENSEYILGINYSLPIGVVLN